MVNGPAGDKFSVLGRGRRGKMGGGGRARQTSSGQTLISLSWFSVSLFSLSGPRVMYIVVVLLPACRFRGYPEQAFLFLSIKDQFRANRSVMAPFKMVMYFQWTCYCRHVHGHARIMSSTVKSGRWLAVFPRYQTEELQTARAIVCSVFVRR